ncbi:MULTISPECIES: hypothetical protein [Micromonospora]|uniref:Uncharacterized protein n=1 Tax=Micromonospora haikouensis TaxID=686309 RepID=A0A0D0X152_9ACTN|nr:MULTISPECIES: hypothetical protein [Micromonospora]KIR64886.1 hypothetical protein TK50_04735 [Micromonospora haikouensis]
MTFHDDDRSALFLVTPTADDLDDRGVTFDGSEEAMRRLRHPFAVSPVDQAAAPTEAGDRPGRNA